MHLLIHWLWFGIYIVFLVAPKIRNYRGKRKLRSLKCKSGGNLRHANLSYFSWEGADLQFMDMEGANLYGTLLDLANLEGANLSGANLSRSSLYKANLKGANMSCADLFSADLFAADLDNAILSDANLSSADLRRTNFSRADLRNTDFNEAELSSKVPANLRGANLRDAKNITHEQLSQAILDKTTILPDGSHWQPPGDEGTDEEL
jgi:uncharacterized protein YjbI with pentapeptide repeats